MPLDELRLQLAKVLNSRILASSDRLRAFLRFTAEKSIEGQQAELKESVIGVEVFRRKPGYNLKSDPIVRVEAHRLRGKLRDYYESEGRHDALEIEFPKGCYVPTFRLRPAGLDLSHAVRNSAANMETHYMCLKGRYWWHRWGPGDVDRAARFFQAALRLDPQFAPAYAGLADCSFIQGYLGYEPPLEAMPRARDAALRAIEIDDSLAGAHCSLGLIENFYGWDSSACRREFERSIELDPGYALARSKYGAAYLTPMGHLDEAREHILAALELDPLSPQIGLDFAYNHFYSHRYEDAAEECRKVLELAPDFLRAYWLLASANGMTGRHAEASRVLREALRVARRDLRTLVSMAIVHYRQGEEESASKILDGIRRARRFVPKIAFAYVALAREDYDGAFQFLNAAFEQREPSLRFLKVHPFFGTLASDHRFAVLLKKLGLGAC